MKMLAKYVCAVRVTGVNIAEAKNVVYGLDDGLVEISRLGGLGIGFYVDRLYLTDDGNKNFFNKKSRRVSVTLK